MEDRKIKIAKKLEKIYDLLGYIFLVLTIISAIIWVWTPFGSKLLASSIIGLVGIFILYLIGPHLVLNNKNKNYDR